MHFAQPERHATVPLAPSSATWSALDNRTATVLLRRTGVTHSPRFLSFDISFLSFPDFLWAHRSGNSSPLRPTRLLLCWFRPQQHWVPPTMQTLASDSTLPRFLSCPKENGAERKVKQNVL